MGQAHSYAVGPAPGLSGLGSLSLRQSYTVPPPTTAPSNTISDCTNWAVASSSDTCATLEAKNGLTQAQLFDYNPSLAQSGCPIVVGDSYCIEENWGVPPASSSPPSSSSTTSATPTGDGVSTPSPIQTGMVGNCNKFHYVVAEDTCPSIAANYSITLDQFYAWNPAVGSDCNTLWAKTYACVGVIGQTSATTTKTTQTPTTTTGNGISTPTPTQSGMVSNCDLFHYVAATDTCDSIAAEYGITDAQFYAWNPAVDQCAALWAKTYACVGIVGETSHPTTTTTTKTTTTSSGNGVVTPTPYESPMVSNCNKFHYVNSGENCQSIATTASISLSNFYTWNPNVGTSCSTLWLHAYVCIGIL